MSRPADLRAHILECLPEIAWVEDGGLREKIVDAYAMALGRSTWERLEQVPHIFSGPEPQGDFLGHVRAVVRLSREAARVMNSLGHAIDERLVLAGALLHDVGKIVEFGLRDGGPVANRRLRHPALGTHIALACGLSDDVAHIVMHHSFEGEIPLPPRHDRGPGLGNPRTMEAFVVARCDELAAGVRQREWAAASGKAPPLDPGVPFSP